MKTIKNIKLLSVLFFAGLVTMSCVKDDDFDTPEIITEEPNVTVNTNIEKVKDFYNGFEPVLITNGGNPMYMEAYVVSSDETGNFYKTLVIQDSPENAKHGISISTESTDMYTLFEPGRKVYVRVDGLYSGEFAGLPTLGVLNGEEVGRMSIIEFEDRVLRSNEVAELVPNVRTLSGVSDADLNTLVAFENVQVSDNDLGEPYANLNNTFSVNRTITNCDRTASIIMRNSGFADFKNELMPEGNGQLTAVMSIFNNDYQVFIRSTADVDFDQERCPVDDGGIIDETPINLPFSEDFEGIQTGAGASINIEGWRNINVTGGERKYEGRSFDGNNYAQISAFGSNETNVEAWLVTPYLNLSGTTSPILNFKTKDGFNNGQALKVFISTNLFESTIEEATWTELTSATIASGTTNGYADNFTDSGNIDLSAYIGQNIHIGFQYVGGSSGVTTTFQIDDVSITD